MSTVMRISMQLDRRTFLAGAGLVAGAVAASAVAVTARVAWPAYPALAATPALGAADAGTEWTVDHIFGTYPPYAHPIPFGRQSAPPVPWEIGSFDPVLMI
jgi:hypothetical protein